ncbi:hypothetical protein M408DRAFT_23127 [Serendipita vermifera MAFF 305830]|uniref:Uncharacterized protein n=1 Tax=Serendipita vermifera MAFF 305830 TaxID=933852 RepID=A0A0C2WT92_SERVB|nr:hypothetical protein M408DRAFT_23127 [Serendipita vermifera MAFF 305830]
MALVASSSSLERGAAEVVDTLTNDNTRIDARNNGVIGPLLNPTVSSTLPLSMPLQSSNTSGRLNMGVILQEYSMFMDRVRHLAALQQTGGIGMRNEDEGHSDYHEPPPGYV